MLSHLPDLLWLPSVIMTVERPTQRHSSGFVSLERIGIMGNLGVIDLSILPPLVDLVSYLDPAVRHLTLKHRLKWFFCHKLNRFSLCFVHVAVYSNFMRFFFFKRQICLDIWITCLSCSYFITIFPLWKIVIVFHNGKCIHCSWIINLLAWRTTVSSILTSNYLTAPHCCLDPSCCCSFVCCFNFLSVFFPWEYSIQFDLGSHYSQILW